jgi:beta-glucosidase
LYPPPPDPGAVDELVRAWNEGPQFVGGDRDSLRLHRQDEELIRAVAAANPWTVVVVVAGAAVVMEEWRHDVPAILVGWYAGMEGGAALADVLLGRSEPGGRLPFAVPREEADLPAFDKDATRVEYDRWYGQRRLYRDGKPAAYPLGFGLSYSSFTIDDVSVVRATATKALQVRARVTNTGSRDGGHVVQVYATGPESRERLLVGFVRVEARAGERTPVTVDVPLERLARWHGPGRWDVAPGEYRIDVGAYAEDPATVSTTVHEDESARGI